MQITPGTQGTGSSLFSGLFGGNNTASGGLFGMLLALFGQNGGLMATAQGGQNLPTSATPGQSLIDLASLLGAADGTQPVTLNGLLTLLQQVNPGQTISPQLTQLLSGDNLTPDMLRERMAALDEDSRDAVMSELASLLQPVMPVLPAAAPATAPEGGDVKVVSVDAGTAAPTSSSPSERSEAKPVLPSLTAAQPASNETGSALDQVETTTNPGQKTAAADAPETNPETNKALEAIARVLEKQQNRADSQAASNAAQTAIARAMTQTDKAASEQAAEKANPVIELSKIPPSNSAAPGTDDDNSIKAATSTVTAPAAPATPTLQPSARSNTNAQTETAIKPVSKDGSEKAALQTATKDSGTATLPQLAPAVATPAESKSFTNHLEQISLNRTGAHMPVADQVAVHLTKAVQNGHDRMTIRLSPAELGRIEVRLDVGSDGMVKASFHVDQPATLDLLQRDQRGLEKALGDAGLKTDGGSLNFNLRGDGMPQRNMGGDAQQGNSGSNGGANPSGFASANEEAERAAAGIMEMTWFVGPDRVDVRI